MATDDIFGEDERISSNPQSQHTQTFHTSTERVSEKSWSKNVKLGFLALISFAIPVIFFLQANELKKKELKNASDLKVKDSLELRLNNYYDTSLQNAKILAYKAYISQFNSLSPNAFHDSYYDSEKIFNQLQNISFQINSLSNDISNIRSNQQNSINKKVLATDSLFVIRSTDNFDNPIKLFNSEIEEIRNNIRTLSNKSIFNDSLRNQINFLYGQIDQFNKRLSDHRLLYGDGNKDSTLQTRNKRKINIINQFIINKTQRTLDSLIKDLNRINRIP